MDQVRSLVNDVRILIKQLHKAELHRSQQQVLRTPRKPVLVTNFPQFGHTRPCRCRATLNRPFHHQKAPIATAIDAHNKAHAPRPCIVRIAGVRTPMQTAKHSVVAPAITIIGVRSSLLNALILPSKSVLFAGMNLDAFGPDLWRDRSASRPGRCTHNPFCNTLVAQSSWTRFYRPTIIFYHAITS